MQIKKTTPILSVERIEPSLSFWAGALGYTKTVEVPHGDRLGFVILQKDGADLMLQTHASLREDLPTAAEHLPPGSIALYLEVDSLAAAIAAVKECEILVPQRTTFYGARETWVRDRDGNVLGFAEHGA